MEKGIPSDLVKGDPSIQGTVLAITRDIGGPDAGQVGVMEREVPFDVGPGGGRVANTCST
jgi:hypothetical protein